MPNEDLSAIYVRVSTNKNSQKDSPEHQKGICEEKLKDLNLGVLYPHYEDRDTGTSIMAREEIQKLVKDAQDSKFKTVIFAALSRFSRDMRDALTLKRTLVDALGIRLISIDENYDSKIDVDEFKFQIISAVNQKLSGDISIASRRGIRQSAKEGNFTGSRAPYGYLKTVIANRKTLIPNPETADILKRMFSMYVNGMGDKAIVNKLNEENIPSYTGKKWGVSTVKGILQNPIYSGKNYYGKYKSKKVYNDINDISNRGNKLFAVNRDEWELSETKQTHEPLIDEETFQLSIDIRKKRNGGMVKRGGSRAKINVFAGLLYCEECGSPLNTVGSTVKLKRGDEQDYRYLVCSTRRRVGITGCDNKVRIRYDEFRDEVIDDIKDKFKKLTRTKNFTDKYESMISEENKKNTSKDVTRIKKVIDDSRKLLLGIRKMRLLEEIDEDQYNFEKSHYENEIKENEEKLNSINSESDKHIEIKSVILLFKKTMDEFVDFNDYTNVEETNYILKQIINRITVSKDEQVKISTPLGDMGKLILD